MLASAIGWALYSIYLFYWKTNLKIFDRFTLIAFFGVVSLLPFYLIEEALFVRTVFNLDFFMWVLFAAISPGIIAFYIIHNGPEKSWSINYWFHLIYIYRL